MPGRREGWPAGHQTLASRDAAPPTQRVIPAEGRASVSPAGIGLPRRRLPAYSPRSARVAARSSSMKARTRSSSDSCSAKPSRRARVAAKAAGQPATMS